MTFDAQQFAAELRAALVLAEPAAAAADAPPVAVEVRAMPEPRSWRMVPIRDPNTDLILEVLLEPLP